MSSPCFVIEYFVSFLVRGKREIESWLLSFICLSVKCVV